MLPLSPLGPVGPVGPTGPVFPIGPVAPVGPCGPISPVLAKVTVISVFCEKSDASPSIYATGIEIKFVLSVLVPVIAKIAKFSGLLV